MKDSILGFLVLAGQFNVHWGNLERTPEHWELYLWTKRN